MKLYHWDSVEALKLYSTGDVVVMAPDVETARTVALVAAETAMLGYTDMQRQEWDGEDDLERREKARAQLLADLEKEPKVFETASAVFVNGGE